MRQPGNPVNAFLQDADWLKAKYVDEGLSTTQVAEIAECQASLVSQYLRRHGINARTVGSEKGHSRFDNTAKRNLSKAKRGKYLGKENPNWRGGQRKIDPERNRFRAKAWSKAIRRRDGICQDCGSFGPLHAHHKKRWKDFPELRYVLSNGVALCHTCHEAAHGRGFVFRWPQ